MLLGKFASLGSGTVHFDLLDYVDCEDVKDLMTRDAHSLQWIESRWHKPQDVFDMGVHINRLLEIAPSTLNPVS